MERNYVAPSETHRVEQLRTFVEGTGGDLRSARRDIGASCRWARRASVVPQRGPPATNGDARAQAASAWNSRRQAGQQARSTPLVACSSARYLTHSSAAHPTRRKGFSFFQATYLPTQYSIDKIVCRYICNSKSKLQMYWGFDTKYYILLQNVTNTC